MGKKTAYYDDSEYWKEELAHGAQITRKRTADIDVLLSNKIKQDAMDRVDAMLPERKTKFNLN